MQGFFHTPCTTTPFVSLQDRVDGWLDELGLHEYWLNFKNNGYTTPRDLEGLKIMNKSDLTATLQDDLGVVKKGHFEKLIHAIKKLQYPSASECVAL